MNPLHPSRSRSRLPHLAPLLAVACLLAPSWAGAGTPAQEGPAETFGDVSDVIEVEVPVQVVSAGRPVQGLGPEDFHILDEGRPRALTSFEVIDLSTGGSVPTAPGAPPVPGAGRRHFLLLFDLAFSRAHDVSKAERAARALLDGGLDPSDLVGVAVYSARRGASLLLNFTSDRDEVRRVLDGLRLLLDGGGTVTENDASGLRRRDPLGLTAGSFDAVIADIGSAAGIEVSLAEETIRNGWMGPTGGRGGGYELNKLMNMMWSAEQQIHDRRAGKVSDLSHSLASLARQTAGIRGSKHLVLFSDGFDADLLEAGTEAGPRTASPGWFATGGGSWLLNDVDAMIEELQRAGWILHAVDLDGLDAGGRFREGLFFVARETGGALYDSTNDVSRSLAEVMEATRVTYLLTFATDSLPAEPAFRHLEVRVDGLPRKARVIHRSGYSVPIPYSALTSPQRRAQADDLLLSGEDHDAIGARMLAVPRRAEDGAWRVPVVIELDGAGLLAGPATREVGTEIYAYAFDADGSLADFFAHRVVFTNAESRTRLAASGLKFLGNLELAEAGSYRVRVLARSLRNGATTLQTVALELPGATVKQPLQPPAR